MVMNKTFSFVSKRGIVWHVVYDEKGYGYMWHRKPDERVTGGWRTAKTDAYAEFSKEAIKVAKECHGITIANSN